MGGCRPLLVAVLIAVCVQLGASRRGYLLTAPNQFHASSEEKVCISFYDIDFDIGITFQLSYENKNLSEQYEMFENGKGGCFKLLVPESSGKYLKLSLTTDASVQENHGYSISAWKKIRLQPKPLLTYIIPDKYVYKPGQTVKFRVITSDEKLGLLQDQINKVYIKDAQGTRVVQWNKIPTKKGIASFEMPLSTEPTLGTWTIVVKLKNTKKENLSFEVKEYVLPKYEVTIKPPKFVPVDAETIEGEVCAKYTYGKPVKGSLLLLVCVQTYYGGRDRPCGSVFDNVDGCQKFSINASQLMLKSDRWPLWGAKAKFFASVQEEGTGVMMNSTDTFASVIRDTLHFNFGKGSPSYYKPGLPYKGKLLVTSPSGTPVPDEEITLKVTKGYRERDLISKVNMTTDENGEIHFTLPTHDQSIVQYQVSASAPHRGQKYSPGMYYMYQPHSMHFVSQWYSPSASLLAIQPISDTVSCDSDIKVKVMFNVGQNTSFDFHYEVIGQGGIIQQGKKAHEAYVPAGKEVIPETTPVPEATVTTQGSEVNETTTLYPVRRFRPYYRPAPPTAQLPQHTEETELSLRITPDMSPVTRILVYYIRDDGEVVADSTDIKVQSCFRNKVGLKFHEAERRPGQDVTLKMMASPGSLCSVGVVDKSAYLLSDRKPLSPQDLISGVKGHMVGEHTGWFDYRDRQCRELGPRPTYPPPGPEPVGFDTLLRGKRSYYPSSSDYKDSMEAFRDTGILVFSDLDVVTRPCDYRGIAVRLHSRPSSAVLDRGSPGSGPEPEQVRKFFPETWVWQLVDISGSESDLGLTVPDTITDWYGAMFCTNMVTGVAVSETSTLRAFQPFFASFSLPYSIIRGEKVPIVVTVFNYLSECLVVRLDLENSGDFNIIGETQEHLCVCGSQSKTHKFMIEAKKLGTLPIKVKAESVSELGVCGNEVEMSSQVGIKDAVIRTIIVEAEGKEKEYTFSNYMCPKSKIIPMTETVSVELPPAVIEGSARGYIQVIGDVMGPTLSGLDQLLRMPYGCGEQNMIRFVPNIFVMQYLTNTNRLDPALKAKAISYLQTGYQRELTYKHSVGSYSAFGKSDSEGSLWLTAFVVKSYSQARPFIFIDPAEIEQSIAWLKSKQQEDGCFPQLGMVHHKALKGGLATGGKPVALTAYVLITLLEAGLSNDDPVVVSAVECLNSNDITDDVYAMSLMVYAYTLYSRTSIKRTLYMDRLMELAVNEGGLKYWQRANQEPPSGGFSYYRAPSAEVEMTSYVLLSLMSGDREFGLLSGLPLVRWISKQRNAYGGFSSTQDTVVALQALAEFAAAAYTDNFDVEIDVQGSGISKTFTVTDSNSLVTQNEAISLPNLLQVAARGSGCTFFQVAVKYNIPDETPAVPAFSLEARVSRADQKPDHCKRRQIQICTKYQGPGEVSNMAVVAVKMVSGWVPIKSTIQQLMFIPNLALKKFAIENNVVNFYFDKLERSLKCWYFNVEQEIKVEGTKPAQIQVYDYYETGLSRTIPYNIKPTCGTKAELPFEPAGTRPRGRSANGTSDWSDIVQRRVPPRLPPSIGGSGPRIIPQIPPLFPPPLLFNVTNSTEGNVTLLESGKSTIDIDAEKKQVFVENPFEGSPEMECPTCLSAAPEDIERKFCEASHVFKVMRRRRSTNPIRVMTDLRTAKKKRINKYVSITGIDLECQCEQLNKAGPGAKFVILTRNGKVIPDPEGNTGELLVTSDSLILRTMPSLERRMRSQLKRNACR